MASTDTRLFLIDFVPGFHRESTRYAEQGKWFDGNLGHWVEPFEGERFSLVYFTHTFKPPCPSLRNVRITEKGLYKKGELIKSYIN